MTIATTLERPVIAVPTELARGRGGGGPALVAEVGAIVIFCGILCQVAQLYVSSNGLQLGSGMCSRRRVIPISPNT
jgi:hypothetical protein